jgi:hypothetical protein
MVQSIKVSRSTRLVTKSPIGWFFNEGQSVEHLHNRAHNTLAIVIPGADCYLEIKLPGSSLKRKETLHKFYANACAKFGIKNIFE